MCIYIYIHMYMKLKEIDTFYTSNLSRKHFFSIENFVIDTYTDSIFQHGNESIFIEKKRALQLHWRVKDALSWWCLYK